MADLILKTSNKTFVFKNTDIAPYSKVFAAMLDDEKQDVEVVSPYSETVIKAIHQYICKKVYIKVSFDICCSMWQFAFQYDMPELSTIYHKSLIRIVDNLKITRLFQVLKIVEKMHPPNQPLYDAIEYNIADSVTRVEHKLCAYYINPHRAGKCCCHTTLCRARSRCKLANCCQHNKDIIKTVALKKESIVNEFTREIETVTPSTRKRILMLKLHM